MSHAKRARLSEDLLDKFIFDSRDYPNVMSNAISDTVSKDGRRVTRHFVPIHAPPSPKKSAQCNSHDVDEDENMEFSWAQEQSLEESHQIEDPGGRTRKRNAYFTTTVRKHLSTCRKMANELDRNTMHS